MKLRYKFRFYPTLEQEQSLAQVFGASRYVYNWGLRLRTDSYQAGIALNESKTSAALTQHKQEEGKEWMNDVSAVAMQQSLRNLQVAYNNFFDKRAAYPSFKKKGGQQSASYVGTAFKWEADNRNLSITKIGRLDVRWSRTFSSEPTTVTVSKDASDRYHVCLVLDEAIEALAKTGDTVGVDLGINRLATLSSGERIANPKNTGKYARKLARAQKSLARKVKGSGRRLDAKKRVAKIQAAIADSRADYLHKATTDLVRRFDVIAIEDLNVRGMVKNHNLAKSISDASFGAFASQLEYKCVWYGKTSVKVDRFFPSSKRCSCCGYIAEKMPLDVREWVCPECKATHDRDENAAKNILAAGLADNKNAHGEHVRPKKVSTLKGKARRSVNRPVSASAEGTFVLLESA